MSDIVNRLRDLDLDTRYVVEVVCSEAADEIERLRARLARVIAYCVDQTDGDSQPHDTHMAIIIGLAEGEPNATMAFGNLRGEEKS